MKKSKGGKVSAGAGAMKSLTTAKGGKPGGVKSLFGGRVIAGKGR
jgi:hypothetical protein